MTRKTCAIGARRSAVLLAGCLAGAVGGAASADWAQGPKLPRFDPWPDDLFGSSIALSGDAAIVGAPSDNLLGQDAGSVHLFRRAGASWNQQTKLFSSDIDWFDAFGTAVAVDGDLAVVGAPGNDDLGDESGSAYVFRYDGSLWHEEAKLLASDGFENDAFGQSVAMSGDRVVIGAPGADPGGDGGESIDSGAAYVFRYDGEGWVEEAKLTGSDTVSGDEFGRAVAMQGDAILVGSPLHDDPNADGGAAYVFRHDGEGAWTEESKLAASTNAAGDEFGNAVAMSKGAALVGASMHGDTDEGTAYVFRFDGEWMEEAQFVNPDPSADDHFGAALAISGDVVVIGAPNDDEKDDDSGAAHVFRYDEGAWYDEAKLMASDGAAGDEFGRAIGVSGTTSLIGAPLDDDHGADSGSVYEYDFTARPALVGEMPSDLFGRAVANAGDVDGDEIDDLLIGAPYNDANGATSGKIYVYSGATLDLIHERAGERAGDRYGWAVAGAGDVNLDGFADYMVSAPWARKSRGRVYVYSGQSGALLRVLTGENKGDRFGYAIAGEADVNNDGREDLLVGAPKNDDRAGNAGKVYAFSGKNWKLLGAMLGENKGDRFGFSVAGLDKANGDAFADFVVGAPKNDDKAKSAGKAYVVSGKKFKVLYAIKGKKAGDQFGYSVAGLGNANGDDRSDFIVGSPYYDRGANANAGRIDVFSGRNGSRLFSRNGENADDRMGHAVAGTDDVDGDGRSDALVGAPRHDTAGANAGRVYVRSGANGGLITLIDGDEAGDMLGWAVAGAGDVDGDGLGDLLISAPLNDAGETNAGRAYLLKSTDELPDAGSWNEPADSDEVAHDPADLDGDGTVDAADIAALLAAWGTGDSAADLNGDGIVDENDLEEILDAS